MVRVTETSNTVNVHHVFGHFLEKSINFLKTLPVVNLPLHVVIIVLFLWETDLTGFWLKMAKKRILC